MAGMTLTCGADRRDLQFFAKDSSGNAVNLTGATSANQKLQGHSTELGGAYDLNYAGTIVDAPNGYIVFPGIGALLANSVLTGLSLQQATFKCKVKWVDAAGKSDYSDWFTITFEVQPI